jgi:hypothetical protein
MLTRRLLSLFVIYLLSTMTHSAMINVDGTIVCYDKSQ